MVDHLIPEPDSRKLLELTGVVYRGLQGRRVVIATTNRPYAVVLAMQLRAEDPDPPLMPQQLLAICDSSAAIRQHLPDDASDVVLFVVEDTLSDGSILPLLHDLNQRSAPPRSCSH